MHCCLAEGTDFTRSVRGESRGAWLDMEICEEEPTTFEFKSSIARVDRASRGNSTMYPGSRGDAAQPRTNPLVYAGNFFLICLRYASVLCQDGAQSDDDRQARE